MADNKQDREKPTGDSPHPKLASFARKVDRDPRIKAALLKAMADIQLQQSDAHASHADTDLSLGAKTSTLSDHEVRMPAKHPRKNDHGADVLINDPHRATPTNTWSSQTGTGIVLPDGEMPEAICGVPVGHWREGASLSDSEWEMLSQGMLKSEPQFKPTKSKVAAGTVIVEPDGRVWLTAPTNRFGGYNASFPKGRPSSGMSLPATALKETFEESGLRVRLLSWLVDVPRSETYTRYYLAQRVSGHPGDMGWETQAVLLTPRESLPEWLNNPNDQPIIEALNALEWPPSLDEVHNNGYIPTLAIQHVGSNLVRVLTAIDGFRRKHGSWPNQLQMHEAALVDLVTRHLTPFGFFLLQSKLKLEVAPETNIIAFDQHGRSFDYGQEGRHHEPDGISAADWLGFGNGH